MNRSTPAALPGPARGAPRACGPLARRVAAAIAAWLVVAAPAAGADPAGEINPILPPSAAAPGDAGHRPAPGDAHQDLHARWLDAVRAQRRALQEQRRVEHQARRRAIDPVGSARHQALEQKFQRRRQEMREMIAEERRLFMNLGPWLTPWPPPAGTAQPLPAPALPDGRSAETPDWTREPPAPELPEWDNGWYFRGW